MFEEKWFVAEYLGNREHKMLSNGFRTYEMARIEYSAIMKNFQGNRNMVVVIKKAVKVEPLANRYKVLAERETVEIRIYEAYAEYRRCNEW